MEGVRCVRRLEGSLHILPNVSQEEGSLGGWRLINLSPHLRRDVHAMASCLRSGRAH